jgi:hypothetical protein
MHTHGVVKNGLHEHKDTSLMLFRCKSHKSELDGTVKDIVRVRIGAIARLYLSKDDWLIWDQELVIDTPEQAEFLKILPLKQRVLGQ